MDVSFLEGFSLIIGGVGAGIINTLAGNGSAITLTLLMAMGLDANMANATNRVGAALQTLTSVLSLRRT
ncbi:MAG: sulfite exporter TauE/SafE family protein, partial [Bacteroidota bacterium]|nr:sulfite exporter TauE/SafE family protein [Bacteroidota bacterium]